MAETVRYIGAPPRSAELVIIGGGIVGARFVDDKLSYVIEVLHSVQAFVEHCVAEDSGYAAAYDAERLARRVVIHRADYELRVQDPKAVRAAPSRMPSRVPVLAS